MNLCNNTDKGPPEFLKMKIFLSTRRTLVDDPLFLKNHTHLYDKRHSNDIKSPDKSISEHERISSPKIKYINF